MSLPNALVAGVIATLVVSCCLVAQGVTNALPGFDLIGLLHGVTGGPRAFGWVLHGVVGLGLALVFAAIDTRLSRRGRLAKGLVFGVLAWVAMMLFVLPLIGGSFFGLVMGWAAPVAALLLNLLYGATLGLCYKP